MTDLQKLILYTLDQNGETEAAALHTALVAKGHVIGGISSALETYWDMRGLLTAGQVSSRAVTERYNGIPVVVEHYDITALGRASLPCRTEKEY